MKAIAAMILLGLLAGCSVNVIVAPHAVLAVDSQNNKDASTNQQIDAGSLEFLPQ